MLFIVENVFDGAAVPCSFWHQMFLVVGGDIKKNGAIIIGKYGTALRTCSKVVTSSLIFEHGSPAQKVSAVAILLAVQLCHKERKCALWFVNCHDNIDDYTLDCYLLSKVNVHASKLQLKIMHSEFQKLSFNM